MCIRDSIAAEQKGEQRFVRPEQLLRAGQCQRPRRGQFAVAREVTFERGVERFEFAARLCFRFCLLYTSRCV